ncbi:hypothetical protein M8C21_002102 [Ambrosia artemisiifolia]|uniref:Mitochondrial carnitine/acylcarnitine carrier-like protein n=1 Tax=Ambrosia artemisiifolia TaxID=4212 RepID=A0AAD5CFT8_AMBAR|nr:hypothetical protein M8C21_002102 [Ambrosia artemisiifolia]
MGDVAKDLASGTVGGVAQLVVGHPFDTIKVKLQSQPTPLPGQLPKYSGAIDAVKKTLAAEVRGQMETLLRSSPGAPLTVNQQFVAGAGAGIAVSFLATPTELIKCRCQNAQGAGATAAAVTEASAATTAAGAATTAAGAATTAAGAATKAAAKYGGPMDVAKQVLRSEGGVRGLYKGLFPTLAREVPGNATMFGVYEALKQYMAGGTDTSGLGRGSLMLAGGLAGGAFWASVYPTDVVKIIQPPKSTVIITVTQDCKNMVKIDDRLQAHTSALPLLSKPDRMETFMRHIIRNPNISKWRKNNEFVPLKTTVMETNNKGYYLDRIESLEDRLIQLSLEIETRRASRTSATGSTHTGAKELPVSSYPVFNNPKSKCKHASSAADILPVSSGGDLQNESETLEQKQKKMKKNGDHQKKKNRKKKAHNWPHLKLLGC